MNIDGKTKVTGLIGNPVEHTKSPTIHNSLNMLLGINEIYEAFCVSDLEKLGSVINGAYDMNILGLNITVPYKQEVIPYLCDIDNVAKQIGAVNTLVRVDKGYKGYNTDMYGLMRAIESDGINLKDKDIIILGAGGAARAVIYMCMISKVASISVLNRSLDKAKSIADEYNELFKTNSINSEAPVIEAYGLYDFENAINKLRSKAIAFQTTSVGLYPNNDDVVLDNEMFYSNIDIGIDIIYNPRETRFMKLVSEHGGKSYNGLKMLLYQGIIAYEYWNDVKISDTTAETVYCSLKDAIYETVSEEKNNIILVGYMGCGKTYIGKELAKTLQYKFIDTDEYIVDKYGKSIKEIFETLGEDYFRNIEKKAISDILESSSNTVISTGGGLPIRLENQNLLINQNKVVWLKAAPLTIYNRVKGNDSRPLLNGDSMLEKINSMLSFREEIYKKVSNIVIETDNMSQHEIIDRIVDQFNLQNIK